MRGDRLVQVALGVEPTLRRHADLRSIHLQDPPSHSSDPPRIRRAAGAVTTRTARPWRGSLN